MAKRNPAKSAVEAQKQLRDIASKIEESLGDDFEGAKLEGGDIAEAALKKSVASNALDVWDMAFSYMKEQLENYVRSVDSEFTKGDVFKCAAAAKDCATLFANMIKKEEAVKERDGRDAILERATKALEGMGVEVGAKTH